MLIGRRVQDLRIRNGLSQAQLAMKAGLMESYICRVEEGHEVPSCEVIEILADALDVPIYQIFYSDGEQVLTPWLTPRRSLEEVDQDCRPQMRDQSGFALKLITSLAGIANRGQKPIVLAKWTSIGRSVASKLNLYRLPVRKCRGSSENLQEPGESAR
ncbi:MAG TPA: helix-turn-helix transcriptional regulator [Terriglobia bacterium]|nr:helix-turn-helix transcriptional regulator [Terriglobia bacterium]